MDNRVETSMYFKDGWFHGNDYGYFDKEGYLYVLGRESEILVKTSQGRLIFAKELEDKIYEVDCVKRCCALVHDKNVVLFVSLRPGIEKEEAKDKIIKYCDDNVDASLLPVKLLIKDDLPITALGKLNRRVLEMECNG